MELLKGHTLRERMAVRPLKIHEAVDIGIQVADALYWAHSRDVIHRDIKPANLFLVDQGQVKILDFGLAKFVVPQSGNETTLAPTIDLTGVGVALGTVAYMSPEQVSGEVLDRRTDLFSLGVVLYECVTGQQPFQGKTSAVVLASILTQQPTPPMALNASVPPGLQEIIHNCLEKDRELRFQDAAGLRADLKRVKRDLESGALRVAHTTSVSTVNAAAPPSDRRHLADSDRASGFRIHGYAPAAAGREQCTHGGRYRGGRDRRGRHRRRDRHVAARGGTRGSCACRGNAAVARGASRGAARRTTNAARAGAPGRRRRTRARGSTRRHRAF